MDANSYPVKIDNILNSVKNLLVMKQEEYQVHDSADPLGNFKKAANLQGCSYEEALGGMLAKHIISIYDLIANGSNDFYLWTEKTQDAMAYLAILQVIVSERLGGTQHDKILTDFIDDGEKEDEEIPQLEPEESTDSPLFPEAA